jgi:NAD(P)-dependent dehydrogenase (short-subunit alcohol dehydrogenase family)
MGMDGEVVIVTGAGKGVGRACALHLARCGARVLVNNRAHGAEDAQCGSAQQVVGQILAEGGVAVASTEDVSVHGAGARLVEQALDTWGRVDMVHANAARAQHAAFHAISLEELRQIVEVGFGSTLELFHAAWPVMRKRGGGRLLATTSSAGRFGGHGLSAYAASKGAVEALVRSLAIEGRRHGIRCNALSPYAASQMTTPHLSADWARMLDPAFLGPVVAWLLSNECTLTGQVIVSGGGRHARSWAVETPGFEGSLDALNWPVLAAASGSPHPDAAAAFAAFMTGSTAFTDSAGSRAGDTGRASSAGLADTDLAGSSEVGS